MKGHELFSTFKQALNKVQQIKQSWLLSNVMFRYLIWKDCKSLISLYILYTFEKKNFVTFKKNAKQKYQKLNASSKSLLINMSPWIDTKIEQHHSWHLSPLRHSSALPHKWETHFSLFQWEDSMPMIHVQDERNECSTA